MLFNLEQKADLPTQPVTYATNSFVLAGSFIGTVDFDPGPGVSNLVSAGSPDAAIVLRSGADSEMVSGFSRENTRIIADAPGLAPAGDRGEAASGYARPGGRARRT